LPPKQNDPTEETHPNFCLVQQRSVGLDRHSIHSQSIADQFHRGFDQLGPRQKPPKAGNSGAQF
jgi:hypothetical protein